jgi:hypothetical protein
LRLVAFFRLPSGTSRWSMVIGQWNKSSLLTVDD